jgi:DNA-binding NarL/FixJ family response regulator
MQTHNIVIVDDHVLIAKALTSIIESFGNYTVLYEVENGKQLIERIQQKNAIPDIILLDINMPEMDGEATAKWLTANHPTILILALSMQNDETSVIKMFKAGAKGYVIKNIHPNELEMALQNLIKYGYYYPSWVANHLAASLFTKNTTGISELKPREVEFLKLCCTEMSYKEMADIMCCSPRTVEGYRDTLFEKLGLKSRIGLVTYTLKNGLVAL